MGANPDCRLCRKTDFYRLSKRPKNVNKPLLCKALENHRIVDFSLGADHSLFLADGGKIFASGGSDRGQLGDLYYNSNIYPDPYVQHTLFSCLSNKCIKVGGGDGFSVLLTEAGEVNSFGTGNYGRLGHSHGLSLSRPAMIDYFRKNKVVVKDIFVGGRHSFAISATNELYVWGFGYNYQLGTGSREEQLEPTKIPFEKKIVSASLGYFHSALILENKIVEDNIENPYSTEIPLPFSLLITKGDLNLSVVQVKRIIYFCLSIFILIQKIKLN